MADVVRTAAGYTHAGRRRVNQDAVVTAELPDGRFLLAVADGMGGHSAGEVASTLAMETLLARLRGGDSLRAAVEAANDAVFGASSAGATERGMGTTVVALLQTGGGYEVANVGDSRAYLVTAAGAERLTLDHSFVAEAVRAGTMTAGQAAGSPWRNALTRAIGTDAAVEVDVFGPFPAGAGQVVLLCSDGLYKSVTDATIAEYVRATEDVESAVRSLAALAFRRGSDDNITVAAVEFGSLPRVASDITVPISIPKQTALSAESRANGRQR